MSIKYTLLPNGLLANNSYLASLRLEKTLDLDAVIAEMDERGTTVAESETRAVLIEFLRVIERQVLAGRRLNLGFVRLFPTIRGTFTGPDDFFDAARHEVVLRAAPDQALKKSLREKATTEKLTTQELQPILKRLYDHGSQTHDATLTPGRTATLIGDHLKFDPDNLSEGVFLVDEATGEATRVDEAPRNKPKEILFLVPPELAAATSYRLELRTRYSDSQQLRSSHLKTSLLTA